MPTKAAPAKTRKCPGIVKVVSPTKVELQPCGTSLSMGMNALPCPNRMNHIMRLKTGHCINGWHEGTNAKTKSGNPAPACSHYLTCPCSCHQALDKMFNMSEMERILVDKSSYQPPERTWWMPSDDPLPALSDIVVTDTPVIVESVAPGRVPPMMTRTFAPTESGKAARGELESWVNAKCVEWVIEEYGWPCTPAWISEEIADDQGIKAPSVGAINAVFNRWVALDYAHIDRRPVQFVKFTEAGIKRGLEGLKADEKRRRQSEKSAAHRGIR